MARERKEPQPASPAGFLTGWARQGVQSFMAAQKIIMDLAAQENALLIGIVRERLSAPSFKPGEEMVGVAEKGIENLAAVGKILLDLATAETALAIDGVKEGLRLPAPAGAMAEVVRHRIDTFIDLQKHLLAATEEQAHAAADSYREGEKVTAAANLAELTRRGIETFVETEKKFLELAAQEITTATKGEKRPGKPPKDRIEVLTKVAREGADKYIETQKKLLELAIEKFEAAAKTDREPKDTAKESSWAELTEKTVKNFVTAEKSLLDIAIKPIRGAAGNGHKASRRHKNPRGAKKATEARHEEPMPA